MRRKRILQREPGANTMRVLLMLAGIVSIVGGVWLGTMSAPVSVWVIYLLACMTSLVLLARRLLTLIDAGFEEEVEVFEPRNFEADLPPQDPKSLY